MGWWRRALHDGRYDDRDRRRQLERYVAAGERLIEFLDERGEPTAAVRSRVDLARRLLRDGWSRDGLLELTRPVGAPWPESKARDSGAVAPEYADQGDRLVAAVDTVALELRAVGERG